MEQSKGEALVGYTWFLCVFIKQRSTAHPGAYGTENLRSRCYPVSGPFLVPCTEASLAYIFSSFVVAQNVINTLYT